MKRILLVSTLVLSLGSTASASDSHQSHEHHKAAATSVNSEVKPGTKFTADDTLKPRMEKILTTMKTLHESGNSKKVGKVKAAGKVVKETVQDIFKNCKLEPAADAAIHPILAEMLEGAELLKKGKGDEGHEKVHQALLKYEELFVHQGWDHSEVTK